MLKLIIRSFFVSVVIVSSAFANDALSAFHQQEDFDAQEPMSEQSYFATLAPLPSRTSAYFGLNLGGGLIPLKTRIAVDDNNSPLTSSDQNKDVLWGNAGLYTGYGFNIDRFYWGVELNFGYNFLSRTIGCVVDGKKMNLRVRQPMTASLDFMPGWLNSSRDMMLYGRLGLATGFYKLNFADETTTDARDNNSNKVALGLNAGIGTEFFISDSFSFRIEYLYTGYNKVNDSYTSINYYSYELPSTGYHRINLGFSIHYY